MQRKDKLSSDGSILLLMSLQLLNGSSHGQYMSSKLARHANIKIYSHNNIQANLRSTYTQVLQMNSSRLMGPDHNVLHNTIGKGASGANDSLGGFTLALIHPVNESVE